MEKISIITPTFNREKYLRQIYNCVLSQDYPNLEWLVLDDSPIPSKELGSLNKPILRYEHVAKRISIGEKRNLLVERAKGDIIVHFDDDDFYAPNYVSTVIASLQEKEADLLNLRGWFLLDRRSQFFGYWNLESREGLHFKCSNQGVQLIKVEKNSDAVFSNTHLGYGFGWTYKKAVWENSKFPDKNWNEDGEFALKARNNFKLDGILDTEGICLHILHATNTSICFPQFHLPDFMLSRYFPTFKFDF